jgi:hypothetical protein
MYSFSLVPQEILFFLGSLIVPNMAFKHSGYLTSVQELKTAFKLLPTNLQPFFSPKY